MANDILQRLLVENVGINDVIPRVQLEVIIDHEPCLLEPIDTVTNMREFRQDLDTHVYDVRHSLYVKEIADGYRLSCGYCHYSLDLRPADDIISNRDITEYIPIKVS